MKKVRESGILTKSKNKHDHINGLLQTQSNADALPAHLRDNKLIKGDINSHYRQNFMFTDEAKQELASQTKKYNFKQDEFSVYANEYIKFKGNLRLF